MSATDAVEEGGTRKTRKPYTITKSRESWTDAEHAKFLQALNLCAPRERCGETRGGSD
jgi:hypothetical protein